MDERINNSSPSGNDGHDTISTASGLPVRTGLTGLDAALGGGLRDGLQPAGIFDAATKVEGRRLVDEMMSADVRRVDAVILKGHGVDCPHAVPLRFHPRTRFFEDAI